MIAIENVSKVYRRDSLEIPVLEDIRLVLKAGEFVALMGPSGSGKTTLLNLIAGLDRPSGGRITVGDLVISGMKEAQLAPWRARNVGFIFQLYNLIPVLTAFENVELPLLLTNLDRKARREHARDALAIVGLADRMEHYPRQLSGGQEQRVAIARAIATDPLMLVADEPTGDLDAKSAEEILDLLNRLNAEFHKTIIMVTHDPRAAARAHRMIHLDKGRLSQSAPSDPAAVAVTPDPASAQLEQRFVRQVVAAMAEYASARTAAFPAPWEAPAPEVTEAFGGLSPSDVFELVGRLDSLFDKPPAPRPSPAAPPIPPSPRPVGPAAAPAGPPPKRSEGVIELERMLAEGAPDRAPASPTRRR